MSSLWVTVLVLLAGQIAVAEPNLRRMQARQTKDKASLSASLSAAREPLENVMSLIFNRYELGTELGRHFFYTASNMDSKAFNILKWRLASKIVQSKPDPTYLMVFSGSSVTAGHDNYFNQSYPMVFKRHMEDIFTKLGIQLIVNNIAQGANNCIPYSFCYETMGGENIDFLNWEQSYNCGRDEPIFENALRMVAWNAPGIVYFSASGSPTVNQCPPSTDSVPYNAENWSPALAGLKAWKVDDSSVEEQKDFILKYNEAGRSWARFGGTSVDMKSVAAMGFNVWEKNGLATCFNAKKNTTEKGCTAADALSCKLHFMTKEASIFGQESGRGANWHPPRAMHMLRGEIIAWQYALVLHETINMVIQDLLAKEISVLATEYAAQVNSFTKDPLPHPKRCGAYHCDVRPQCFTNFVPHYRRDRHLSDVVVGNVQWKEESTELGDWSKKYGYLDAKPGYSVPTNDTVSELHVTVKVNALDILWICGNGKAALASAEFFLDTNVKLPSKKALYQPSEQRQAWSKIHDHADCRELYELPKGDHVLSVKNKGGQLLSVTHVVTW